MEQLPRGEQDTPGAEALGLDALLLELAAQYDTLPRDSDGQVKPGYVFIPRLAGRIGCGELVLEPGIGPARAAATLPMKLGVRGGTPFVQITWTDDLGPCRAAAQ